MMSGQHLGHACRDRADDQQQAQHRCRIGPGQLLHPPRQEQHQQGHEGEMGADISERIKEPEGQAAAARQRFFLHSGAGPVVSRSTRLKAMR
jgi:hypothetical protein